MQSTLSQLLDARPSSSPCAPVWCKERQMAAKVSPGQVVTLRYDTGALEKCPISGARGADAPTTAPTNRAPALDPRLLRAIKGAKIGEQRMYLGAGRNRRVWIESIEPALRRAA